MTPPAKDFNTIAGPLIVFGYGAGTLIATFISAPANQPIPEHIFALQGIALTTIFLATLFIYKYTLPRICKLHQYEHRYIEAEGLK